MRREWAVNPAELTQEQKDAIQLPLAGNYAVVGPPGSGKTNILLLRAKYLMRASNGTVLCLVFTAALKDFIRKGMTEYEIAPSFVQTFHGWGKGQLQMNRVNLDLNDAENFSQVAPHLRALLKDGKIPKFDYLLVDEAQDFSEDIIKLFFQLSDNVTLFFDKNQSIHQNDTSNPSSIFPIGIRSSESNFQKIVTLSKNFRVPFKIAELATKIMPTSELDQKTDKTDGNEPIYESFGGVKDEREFIKKRIADIPNENPDYNFAILQKTTKDKLPDLQKDFVDLGLPTEVIGVYKYKCDFNNTVAKLTTYSSVKGLEFDVIFAADATASLFPGNATDKNLAFVAVTRAKKRIYITASSSISKVFCPPPHSSSSLPTIEDLF